MSGNQKEVSSLGVMAATTLFAQAQAGCSESLNSGVHHHMKRIDQYAGIEIHASPAKNLIDAGVFLEKVAALLGHSDLNTTRVYITPGEKDLEKTVELLEYIKRVFAEEETHTLPPFLFS